VVSLTLDKALSVLQLDYPFDDNSLKSAFRLKSKETHPDCGGNSEDFKKVISAYELLKEYVQEFSNGKGLVTTDGVLLDELGKGLPEKNAAQCKNCNGLGYTVTINNRMISGDSCPACSGLGMRYEMVGMGFRRRRGLVRCQRCQGRGVFSPVYSERTLYHVCSRCKGIGEIEIYNPVLKKGVVITKEKYGKKNNKKKYCPECGARISAEGCWRCNSTIGY